MVRGIGMTFIPIPLHKVKLESELISNCVVVGVRPSLPVAGIDFLLGNDIAGGDIWGKLNQSPEVVAVTRSSEEDEMRQKVSGRFPILRCHTFNVQTNGRAECF